MGDQIINLNIGGVIFSTLRSTLLSYPNSMLNIMFSGKFPSLLDSNGNYFIDRNGKLFEGILYFFRTKKFVATNKEEKEKIREEADYFGHKNW